MMRKLTPALLSLLLLLPMWPKAQDAFDHRGVQFATQGTDFWVCFPRTVSANGPNYSRLYVVSERDCDVTVSNPILDFTQTYHVARRVMAGPDTNYILLPELVCRYVDELVPRTVLTPNDDLTGEVGYRPQPRAFHVTSTDTIALYLFIYANGASDVTNVLPTEMLRDEYVTQQYPRFRVEPPEPDNTYVIPSGNFFTIVATEDSTVVDIRLADWDWMRRPPGTEISVTLNAGELYHVGNGELRDKYYPLFYPYAIPPPMGPGEPPARFPILTHGFTPRIVYTDTFTIDLSGSYIKARDCKRIAVFEGSQCNQVPLHTGFCPGLADYFMEQAIPTRYASTEFLLPPLQNSDTTYIRFTGIHDSTVITIRDVARLSNSTRRLTIHAGATDWFQMDQGEGPFYITSTHPVVVKEYAMGSNAYYNMPFHDFGDPAVITPIPVEWWHGGQVNYGTVNNVDANYNRNEIRPMLHIFARTADVDQIKVDDYFIRNDFRPMAGTPYSYAHYDFHNPYNSEGTHHIVSTNGAPFTAILDEAFRWNHAITNLSHVQPGNSYLRVNDIPADSLKSDSIWCMYDPIRFHSWIERPADSIIWDFGDGHVERYRYEEGQRVTYTYGDTGRYEVRRIITFEDEGCFTMKPDTMTAPIWIHNHYDTTFAVRLCEGSYTFRGYEFGTTDTHYVTTYWTPSGCDTLWHIALVTCPRCTTDVDSVLLEDLPWHYHGQVFYGSAHGVQVHFDPDGGTGVGEGCDSIVTYHLFVVGSYEEVTDSVMISVPNIFTPGVPDNGEANCYFKVIHNNRVARMEVEIYDRRGERMAKFDGLTESWDGTSRGRPCPQGAYVYHIRYIDENNRNWQVMYGTVTLLR